ncbi:ATP-dependent Clp protease ATP-binding subunit [Candidatus Dojkabacteria bacterium]|nr:ATP-dependent Clp protease ATP-binding subunit [Candidatus Dojkabacteria bacterium]
MSNPFRLLTENAKSALKISSVVADRMGARDIMPLHLFISLLLVKEGIASRVLSAMKIDIDQTLESFAKGVDLSDIRDTRLTKGIKDISSDMKALISRAYSIARQNRHVYVGTEHLLLAILDDDSAGFVRDLETSGLKVNDIKKNILNFTTYPEGVLSRSGRKRVTGKPTALEVFGRDLTEIARRGLLDPIVGREDEINQIIKVLSRRRKNNAVVVGEAGVGKTALVEGLAQRIVSGNVPESLRDAKIVSLDVTGIVAGSKMRGDMEEKMMAVINEVSSSPNIILFIDEIHTILGVGGAVGGGLDLAGVLKPALVHGNFRCIGATTAADYSRYFEDDAALSRRFQRILVEEPSVEEAVEILKRIRPLLESHHNVVITDEAVETAVRLSDQYVSDRYLPDKAIDLMDEAAATRRLQLEGKYNELGDVRSKYREIIKAKEGAIRKGDIDSASDLRKQEEVVKAEMTDLKKKRGEGKKSKEYHVNVGIIREIVSKWTGIPLTTLGAEESSSLINLEDVLESKVIGQQEAVEKVAAAIKRARTGVTSGERPWASFLFLGPTGVGKTELAKVLTKTLFGEEDRLIQIDMSEMMEMHSVSKLIGSPPGYVGYREGGQLTEQVRKQPHSVILFDEIEKAHIDVLNILLQILEYGHLTDGKGRRVNFKNTVIILTSNIGAEEIGRDKVLGFRAEEDDEERSDENIEGAYEGMKETLLKKLRDDIRPELLNRLDDIVIFRSLTRKDAKNIVDLLLDELNERLEEEGVEVVLDASAVDFIVEKGFSEDYGARPLRRTIQDYVETPIASYLLRYGGGLVWKGKGKKSSRKKKVNIKKSKKAEKLIVSKGK